MNTCACSKNSTYNESQRKCQCGGGFVSSGTQCAPAGGAPSNDKSIIGFSIIGGLLGVAVIGFVITQFVMATPQQQAQVVPIAIWQAPAPGENPENGGIDNGRVVSARDVTSSRYTTEVGELY